MIHGNLSAGIYYKPLMDRLPDDVHAYALDLRGFGDSSYLNPFNSLAELATDVKLFMNQLKIEKSNHCWLVTWWRDCNGICI